MEQRAFAHQRDDRQGALVPAVSYSLPLLPYERDLIAELGISEQEYREFAAEVSRNVKYELLEGIPVAGPALVPILINLAIGAVLTGVSMLLAPKPQQQNREKQEQKVFEVSSQQGRTRFNNSTGFDGSPQIALLGTRVPIPFGMYEPAQSNPDETIDGYSESGGLLVEPLLVWSRMTSHGKHQAIKFLTVMGQAQVEGVPELAAIFSGGQPIGNFYKTNYWVAYSSEKGGNRLYRRNGIYGQAAEGEDAPSGIFFCPTFDGWREGGFSMAHTPANTTSFGVYQTIPNGGHWKLNWELVGYPRLKGQKDDPTGRIVAKRTKIAGRNAKNREDGMAGTGRPYSVKMGIVAHNGTNYSLPTEVTASLGDRFTFKISGGKFTYSNLKIDSGSEVGVDDLNTATNSMRERADDLLQTSEVFLVNRTLMRVTSRPTNVWHPNAGDFYYELEVIGFTGSDRDVGVIGTRNVDDTVLGEGGENDPYETFRESNWYPLNKVDFANVKNTRAVEVTEIGIRSQVWARANGLFNLAEVPPPKKLREYDEEGYQLQGGTISKYMRRTAFFMLAVRDPLNIQGYDEQNGVEDNYDDELMEGFDILGEVKFAVRGTTPVDQFSYIRIRHPKRQALEFRLIPKAASTVISNMTEEVQNLHVLDAGGPQHEVTVTSPFYGQFTLVFNASVVPLDELLDLPELQAGTIRVDPVYDCSSQKVGLVDVTPAQGGGQWQGFLESLDNDHWNLKPHPDNSIKNVFGQERTATFQAVTEDGSALTVEVRARVIDAGGEDRIATHGTAKAWEIQEMKVISGGSIQEGDRLTARRDTSKTWHYQWFKYYPASVTREFSAELTGSCIVVRPGYEYDRDFESKAGIKEVSVYQEITKSCDSGPELSVTYVNESVTCNPIPEYPGMTMLGFKLRSMNRTSNFNQIQVWMPNGISVDRLVPELFPDGKAYGPSNNFADLAYYLLTNKEVSGGGIGREIQPGLVAREWFEYTARFLDNHWFRFDGAIDESVNLRAYLSEMAPYFMCNFVMVNGKFALKPALPTNGNTLNQGPVDIAMMFTDGTIVDGSFKLTYLPQGDRQDFRANMIYRKTQKNTLIEKRSIMVRWHWDENFDDDPSNDVTSINQEDYDISSFCTRRSHAFAAARYLLSIRRRVDHTIEFQTSPEGLSLAPGDFIRIDTKMSPYENFQNGVVRADGSVLSPSPLKDGTVDAFVYLQGSDDVVKMPMTIKGGYVADPKFRNSLFNVPSIARRLGVYAVETIGIEDDGLVKIAASHHPVYDDLSSKIVADVMDPSRFYINEESSS